MCNSRLFGPIIIVVMLVFTSCGRHVRVEDRYEAYFLFQNDSLVLIQRDSVISLPDTGSSVGSSRLFQKAGKDTLRIEGNLLKSSYSIIKAGEKVERIDLHYQLLNNRDQEIASIRFVDEDSTEELDGENGRQTIVTTGSIGKMPAFLAAKLSALDSFPVRTIASLKQYVKKESFDMGTQKKLGEE